MIFLISLLVYILIGMLFVARDIEYLAPIVYADCEPTLWQHGYGAFLLVLAISYLMLSTMWPPIVLIDLSNFIKSLRGN